MKYPIIILILTLSFISCTSPEPRKPILRKSSTFLQESIQRNKIINKVEEAALLDVIKKDTAHSYIASENGFWYYYQQKNTAAKTTPVSKGDRIVYTYQIEDVNGVMLYTEKEIGKRNYLVDKQEIIPGLHDGLKLMHEGEKVTFLFPSHKAYGYAGYKKINGNQPLLFTVAIKEIIKN